MTTWFVWTRGPKGLVPQLVYDAMPNSLRREAAKIVELTEEDKERVKNRNEGKSVLDVLREIYPEPEYDR